MAGGKGFAFGRPDAGGTGRTGAVEIGGGEVVVGEQGAKDVEGPVGAGRGAGWVVVSGCAAWGLLWQPALIAIVNAMKGASVRRTARTLCARMGCTRSVGRLCCSPTELVEVPLYGQR